MKLQPDRSDSLTINAHGPGWIAVNGQQYRQSVTTSKPTTLPNWPTVARNWCCLAVDNGCAFLTPAYCKL